ncbi:P68 family surface lipoprotein [Mycoplasma sp. CSL7503-lung]|uniref:P68 family surface lipoprotein n=1 Tax=Mycoplasma sp. CSL7503-lung TaxID=536372 RepID=UPI0021D0DDE4|nr:P80 family lipoprotein [Mycoplasma sp. CSL7503-lung]MCU4706589.1 P80 family lipoprotein [Mycoplasma sp. CSL7503-lung]
MNNKFKKFAFALSGVSSFAALSVAISCGQSTESVNEPSNTNSGSSSSTVEIPAEQLERVTNASIGANTSVPTDSRFDQVNDGVIKIGTTFSETGPQARSLNETLKVYNALVEQKETVRKNNTLTEEQKQEEYKKLGVSEFALPVQQQNLGSGYDAGKDDVSSKLNAKDTNGFYNLTINYAPVAATLASKNMLLSFNDQETSINTDITEFDKSFVSNNDDLENVVNKSTYVLPFFKSTQVLSINASVMSYILETMVENGATYANSESKAEFQKMIDAGKGDRASVEKIWGQPVSTAQTILSNVKLDFGMFDNYSDLVKFSIIAQSLFTESAKNTSSSVHVFGIDDIAGVYEQALYSSLNADPRLMLQKVVRESDGRTTINFTNIKNSNQSTYKNSNAIFNVFSDAFEKGAVYAFPGGQYSSTTQTEHKIAFSIGSTAGYSYNFKKAGKAVSIYKTTDGKVVLNDDNKTFLEYGLTPKKGEKPEDVIGYISSYKNQLLKSTSTKEVGKYDYKSKDASSDTKLEAFLNTESSTLLVIDKKDFDLLKVNETFKANETELSSKYVELMNGNKEVALVLVPNTNKNDFLAKLGLSFESRSDQDYLNENELISRVTPTKWESTDAKKVLYLQGPSLIGVHANEVEDNATKAFVKWLMNNKEQLLSLQKSMSYITPVANFNTFTEEDKKKIYGNNKYLQVALEEFGKVSEDDNYVAFEEPAGEYSASFRKQIKAAWDARQKEYSDNAATKTDFNKFVETMTQGLNAQ